MQRFAGLAALMILIVLFSLEGRGKPALAQEKAPDKNSPGFRNLTQLPELEGKSLTEWVTAVRNPDASLRERAISALPLFGKVAGTSEVVNLLLERFEDRDASPRLRAVMVMNQLDIPKDDRTKVIRGLIGKLADQQGLIRYHAAMGLQRFGDDARSATTALCSLAEDGVSWEIRRAALAGLISVARNTKGNADKAPVLALYRRANDVASEVRLQVAAGLGAFGRTSDRTVDGGVDSVLKTLVKDKDPRVAIWANLSTMALNKEEDVNIQAIASHMKSKDAGIRRHAVLAFAAMGTSGTKRTCEYLLDATHDKDPGVAMAALGGLVSQGENSPAVIEAIKDVENNKDLPAIVRESARVAAGALRKIKVSLEESPYSNKEEKAKITSQEVPLIEGKDLRQWLEDLRHTTKDPSLREKAINAIPFFSDANNNSEVVAVLLERINDKNDLDVSPRLRAIMVLNMIEIPKDDYSRVVETFTSRLKDTQRLIRYYATLGLKRIGQEAQPAIPALAELVEDKITWEVRRAALSALMDIGKTAKGKGDPRAIEAMLKGVADKDCADIRLEAAMGLVALGKPEDETLALKVETQLNNLVSDKDQRVAIWGRVGLLASKSNDMKGDDAEMLMGIADQLKSPEVPVRVNACIALAFLGPKGVKAQPKLFEALGDKEATVFLGVLKALVSQEDSSPLVLGNIKEAGNRKELPPLLKEAAQQAFDTLRKKKKQE